MGKRGTMTDKQIIIDGERCQYLSDTGLCRLIYNLTEKSYDCSMCKNNPNCYYKQLKRKEQECDMWKNLTVDNGAVALKYQQQIDQLKAENKELKKCYKNNSTLLDFEETNTTKLVNKVMKLEKTLTEIKEICNNNDELKGDFNLVDCDKYKLGKHNLANKILQKISECEVD